ncbi:Dabb family protein [Niveibacterium sp. SC-1]|uniref:Dabb family protein n=1 Tax=Niveibacterium sp. SC-1 TaxID=3135646 RepID=UPI00311F2431
MIRHIVLFRFEAESSPAARAALITAFRALPALIAEVRAFEEGPNLSPEGLGQGFDHAFVMRFADAPARDAYLAHPAHQAFVAQTRGVVAQALVFDLAAGSAA